jgi:hypothetical protein
MNRRDAVNTDGPPRLGPTDKTYTAQMDLNGISEILRMLPPRQEKVIRLYFGLGCQRPHSALEIAQAFEVSSQVIAGILGASQRRLAGIGLTAVQIREAARWEAELQHQPGLTGPQAIDCQNTKKACLDSLYQAMTGFYAGAIGK